MARSSLPTPDGCRCTSLYSCTCSCSSSSRPPARPAPSTDFPLALPLLSSRSLKSTAGALCCPRHCQSSATPSSPGCCQLPTLHHHSAQITQHSTILRCTAGARKSDQMYFVASWQSSATAELVLCDPSARLARSGEHQRTTGRRTVGGNPKAFLAPLIKCLLSPSFSLSHVAEAQLQLSDQLSAI